MHVPVELSTDICVQIKSFDLNEEKSVDKLDSDSDIE